MILPGPVWTPRRTDGPIDPDPGPINTAARHAPAAEGVISRTAWSRGRPVPTLMNRMTPVTYITVHHTAMAFQSADRSSTAAHIESIRRFHRNDRGWGDIGYHYLVDRAGRVWEGRPIAYQGAHVADHNPGNIGVVALGNFDQQSATTAQLSALQTHLRRLMGQYRVPVSRLRTHQEWAATACPGRSMQRYMSTARSNRAFG